MLASLLSAALAAQYAPVMGPDRPAGPTGVTRSEVLALNGMAATSQPLATQIALDVLKSGGTAVDAAIAANAALGLMEPTGCGIGGDLFALVWDPATRRLHAYNGSGRAPAAISIDALAARGITRIPSFGPLPLTVPGAVDGWFALHQRFGRLPMSELLAHAIRYAREGFPVTEIIAQAWETSVRRYREFPGFLEQFTLDGRAPGKGDIWRNPNLADTYDAIARGGRDAFYTGRIPDIIERYVASQGGYLAAEDFQTHRGEWVEPVSVRYRDVEVWEIPPNGQGIAALQILNILEGFDLRAMGFGTAEYVHHFVEAKKLAFEDRARYYADPDFARVPVLELLSKDYAASRRSLIDPRRAATRVPPGEPVPSAPDTVYLTVADRHGMMVSLIQSNYRGMGSGMTPPGLGFMLQNRGEQFALRPDHPNALAPRKRPFHTIIPGFITRDGAPWVSFGVMGGDMQPQGHAQIVINLVDFGMNLQQAGDAPRIHHEGSTEPVARVTPMTDGGVVHLESAFPHQTIRDLVARGHRVQAAPGVFGGYQAIMRDPKTGVYIGASESRKDGHAAGY